MIEKIVEYWDLGRNDAKGKVKIVALNVAQFNDKMEHEFSKHLLSRDISFEILKNKQGIIFAGFHKVGNFRIRNLKTKE